MKKSSKILVAGLLGLSAAGIVNAQDVILITGSTAFRAQAIGAIEATLNPGYTCGYTGSSLTGGNQAIFSGTFQYGSPAVATPVVIKCDWTGSAGGVQTVSQQLPISSFLSTTANGTLVANPGTAISTPVFDSPEIPDVGFEDGAQRITYWPVPVLTGQTVGTVDFKFIATGNAPSGLNNMTPELAQALWGSATGTLPLSMFTANPSDSATTVVAFGRDPDSGTRQTALQETGIGNLNLINQWEPTNAENQVIGNASGESDWNVAGITLWPQYVINNTTYPVGDAGYNSGGNLAKAMQTTPPTAFGGSTIFVAYLSIGDSATALAGTSFTGATPAKELTYNGVLYSKAGVENGQYSFWTYEHLNYRSNYGSVDAIGKNFADQTAANVPAALGHTGTAGEELIDMNVSRQIEGGTITFGN